MVASLLIFLTHPWSQVERFHKSCLIKNNIKYFIVAWCSNLKLEVDPNSLASQTSSCIFINEELLTAVGLLE